MRVFVLIFNAGTDNEGIHTIRVGDRDTILMFESEDDATRYALMLEAQDFLTPTIEAMDAEEIKGFCEDADHDWKIVPANSNIVITPPEINLEETDWRPDEYQEDTDEETYRPDPETTTEPELPNPELDRIRRQLEGLL